MSALRLLEWNSEPVLAEVEDPVPLPGPVVVWIGGAGASHPDLHLMSEFESGLLPWGPPFTLGPAPGAPTDGLEPVTAALPTDAGLTSNHAVRSSCSNLPPGPMPPSPSARRYPDSSATSP